MDYFLYFLTELFFIASIIYWYLLFNVFNVSERKLCLDILLSKLNLKSH